MTLGLNSKSRADRIGASNDESEVQRWDLETLLLYFSEKDFFTLRDAFSGVGIFGTTGAGKSSGSGQALARAYLSLMMGGLVLCAKKSEARTWLKYAAQEGREKSIIHIRPDKNMLFDFLGYVMRQPGGKNVENILHVFNRVIEITSTSDLSKGENAYFYIACQELLRNAITLSMMAFDTVSLGKVYDIVTTAPTSAEESKSDDWMAKSQCFNAVITANEREQRRLAANENAQPSRELRMAVNYFLNLYPDFGDRLRSSISSIFTSAADPWLRGDLWHLFGRSREDIDPETGEKPFYLDPDYCKEGAIYLFDFPVKESHTGRLAQALFKFMWQAHMEKRDVETDGGRPTFLWADEAQLFTLPEADAEFAQTARSSRVATVLLSQNISNYYAAFGHGENGINQTESLLGNLGTLIFHANSHEKTNQWASQIIGTHWQQTASTNYGGSSGYSSSETGGSSNSGSSFNTGFSEQQRAVVEPREFTLLATGGEANNFKVEAIITQAGRMWNATESNHIHVSFDQHPEWF